MPRVRAMAGSAAGGAVPVVVMVAMRVRVDEPVLATHSDAPPVVRQ